MATAIVRSGLRSALRGGASAVRASPASKRSMSSSAHHDEAAEAAKWEKITYLGAASCSILAIYCLSKGHPHSEEPPAYPYLHMRNKEFPWGPDGLFEIDLEIQFDSETITAIVCGCFTSFFLFIVALSLCGCCK